ncbi:hypothetical protein M885DRAFT_519337 [Pelagophyceae sp. CCMP2097]|nr:hypothetical protein M885DRAFT_519337 [Pelagophyceae sp. CCMP2097]
MSIAKIAARRGKTVERTLQPTEDEFEAIAERLDVDAVLALSARIDLTSAADIGDVIVRGAITAKLEQTCVVTGEAMAVDYAQNFTVVATTREPDGKPKRGAPVFEAGGAERLDAFDNNVDVGELVLQFLAMAVDPYPRSVVRADGAIVGLRDRSDEETRAEAFELGRFDDGEVNTRAEYLDLGAAILGNPDRRRDGGREETPRSN